MSWREMIDKRSSCRSFTGTPVAEKMLETVRKLEMKPLYPEIGVHWEIVPRARVKCICPWTTPQVITVYSEKKPGYLPNIGYIGEQLDLHLASMNIGALWFGIGKVEEQEYNGLDFVIMIAIAKMPEDKFRKNMFKSKRKPLDEIWHGEYYSTYRAVCSQRLQYAALDRGSEAGYPLSLQIQEVRKAWHHACRYGDAL